MLKAQIIAAVELKISTVSNERILPIYIEIAALKALNQYFRMIRINWSRMARQTIARIAVYLKRS